MRIISPVVTLGFGLAIIPANACDQLKQASNEAVIAFLSGHSVPAQSVTERQLAACKENQSPCKADSDCCSGACKDVAEGQACVPK